VDGHVREASWVSTEVIRHMHAHFNRQHRWSGFTVNDSLSREEGRVE
jgi:hypothetical protein